MAIRLTGHEQDLCNSLVRGAQLFSELDHHDFPVALRLKSRGLAQIIENYQPDANNRAERHLSGTNVLAATRKTNNALKRENARSAPIRL